jgi:hypothetical protein
MEIGRSDFDDSDDVEVDDILDNDLILEVSDDSDETFVKPAESKLDIRRRLEQYLEDVRLKRELDLY